jgi:hypothetical protein
VAKKPDNESEHAAADVDNRPVLHRKTRLSLQPRPEVYQSVTIRGAACPSTEGKALGGDELGSWAMKLDNRLDTDTTVRVVQQILEVLSGDPDLTAKEAMTALVFAMGSIVLNMESADCRRVHAKIAGDLTPKVLRDAMEQAANGSPNSLHCH